jgi:DNA-binding NarL/FixJ family response regulator
VADTAATPIRVLVVDDHWEVREGVAVILEGEPDIDVVAAAATAAEAVAAFEQHDPDVVIMDLQLPDLPGVGAIREIRRRDPDARIVVLSMYNGDEDVHRAIAAGASTYLIKGSPSEDLIRIVRDVHSGQRPMRPDVKARLDQRAALPTLTLREFDVLELVAKGKRNKEIAAELTISERTLDVHLKHIFTKLGVHDRTAAVYIALRRGIIHIK